MKDFLRIFGKCLGIVTAFIVFCSLCSLSASLISGGGFGFVIGSLLAMVLMALVLSGIYFHHKRSFT